MTTATAVPAVRSMEAYPAISPSNVSLYQNPCEEFLYETPPSDGPRRNYRSPACVILSASGTNLPREIARRVTNMLEPLAVDITGLSDSEAFQHQHGGHAVFLISSTDWRCLEQAKERAASLHLHGLEDRCGLVLWHVPGGATAEQAEDYTEIPVCALLDRDEQLIRFARWISAEHRRLGGEY